MTLSLFFVIEKFPFYLIFFLYFNATCSYVSIGVINFTISFVHFAEADAKSMMTLSPTLLTQ